MMPKDDRRRTLLVSLVFAGLFILGTLAAVYVNLHHANETVPTTTTGGEAAPDEGRTGEANGSGRASSVELKDYSALSWAVDRAVSSFLAAGGGDKTSPGPVLFEQGVSEATLEPAAFEVTDRSQSTVHQRLELDKRWYKRDGELRQREPDRVVDLKWVKHTLTVSLDERGDAARLETAALARRIERKLSGQAVVDVDIGGPYGEITVSVSDRMDGRRVSFVTHKIRVNFEKEPGEVRRSSQRIVLSPLLSQRQEPVSSTGSRGRLALVIDDWGYEWSAAERLLTAGVPLTVAVIPHLPESESQAARAHAFGHEVIVHIPMEPLNSELALGKGGLRTGMGEQELRRTIEQDVSAVPFAVGVSNHMGSKATADRRLMSVLLSELKNRRMYFFDSNTSAKSVAPELARSLGVPYAVNRRFIDNVLDVERIERELRVLADIAVRQGSAIGVGHVHPQTAEAIIKSIPYFEEKGVELVVLSELLTPRTSPRALPARGVPPTPIQGGPAPRSSQ